MYVILFLTYLLTIYFNLSTETGINMFYTLDNLELVAVNCPVISTFSVGGILPEYLGTYLPF